MPECIRIHYLSNVWMSTHWDSVLTQAVLPITNLKNQKDKNLKTAQNPPKRPQNKTTINNNNNKNKPKANKNPNTTEITKQLNKLTKPNLNTHPPPGKNKNQTSQWLERKSMKKIFLDKLCFSLLQNNTA